MLLRFFFADQWRDQDAWELIKNNRKNHWTFTSLKKMSSDRNSALSSTTLKDTYPNGYKYRCLSQSSLSTFCICCCKKDSFRIIPELRALSILLMNGFCTQSIATNLGTLSMWFCLHLDVEMDSSWLQDWWFLGGSEWWTLYWILISWNEWFE